MFLYLLQSSANCISPPKHIFPRLLAYNFSFSIRRKDTVFTLSAFIIQWHFLQLSFPSFNFFSFYFILFFYIFARLVYVAFEKVSRVPLTPSEICLFVLGWKVFISGIFNTWKINVGKIFDREIHILHVSPSNAKELFSWDW